MRSDPKHLIRFHPPSPTFPNRVWTAQARRARAAPRHRVLQLILVAARSPHPGGASATRVTLPKETPVPFSLVNATWRPFFFFLKSAWLLTATRRPARRLTRGRLARCDDEAATTRASLARMTRRRSKLYAPRLGVQLRGADGRRTRVPRSGRSGAREEGSLPVPAGRERFCFVIRDNNP